MRSARMALAFSRAFLRFGLREIKNNNAVIHKSVYRRFAAGPVVLFDKIDS